MYLGLEPLSIKVGSSLLTMRSIPEGRALALSLTVSSHEQPGRLVSRILQWTGLCLSTHIAAS